MTSWVIQRLNAFASGLREQSITEYRPGSLIIAIRCFPPRVSILLIILNLEDEEAQRVGTILHLSEAELMEITHFERGSALISTNNNNVAVEIKCSELEKELITTDRRELQELLKRNGKTG